MKKVVLLSALFIAGCASDADSEDNPLPAHTIEGKWVYPANTPFVNDQGISNTMYLFKDGIRYTYYCISEMSEDCESLYESFEAGDGNHIPGTNPYTFNNDTLTVDLHFGNTLTTSLTFECNGNKVNFQESDFSLTRLGTTCN